MPHLFFSGMSDEKAPVQTTTTNAADEHHDKENMWERTWKQMGNWLKKEDENESPQATPAATAKEETPREELSEKLPCQETMPPCRPSHNVIPSIPRPITFKRQDSERRERLYPHEPDHEERRATSADRRLGTSYERKISPLRLPELATSIPKHMTLDGSELPSHTQHHDFASTAGTHDHESSDRHEPHDAETSSHYDWQQHDLLNHSEQLSDALSDLQLHTELESKWILNLSMHFRDHSLREKFFITYAESPSHWRRLTVSCDYRSAPEDSLEADLASLHYQRDKSARIYEAIRDSLCGIQFYEGSVTNLKLETSGGRLHVHVTEDVNEVIEYPRVESVAHLDLPRYAEETIEFETHMSGFVYKVRAITTNEVLIKKEIPGPEAIDEFLYEINALAALRDAPNVIAIRGLVVDTRHTIKGILLHYCPNGALVDLLYKARTLTLPRLLHWSHNLLTGLSAIHESGFVQGDFTLSNIVIDADDTLKIIDINRRGCPIGWEPPEMSGVIRNGGRVGMYIGVKSDLWQCGMCLWGLVEGIEEPERCERPLRWSQKSLDGVPLWFREVVEICLSEEPRGRRSAAELLGRFPVLPPREEVVVRAPDVGVEHALENGSATGNSLLDEAVPDPHVRQPSPLANSQPGPIETSVEYLVPETADRHESNDQPLKPRLASHQEPQADRDRQSDATSSVRDDAMGHGLEADSIIDDENIGIPQKSLKDAISDAEDVGTPMAAFPPTPNPVLDGNEPLSAETVAHPIEITRPALSGAADLDRPPAVLELGDPPLATFSPPDRTTQDCHTSETIAQHGETPAPVLRASDQTPAVLELGNPPLATFSPPVDTPVTAVRVEAPQSELLPSELPTAPTTDGAMQEGPADRQTLLELGRSPLATFSPPTNTPITAVRADAPQSELVPSENASASTTDARMQKSPVDTVIGPRLGNPPLATFSPPPNLDTCSTQTKDSSVAPLQTTTQKSGVVTAPTTEVEAEALGNPPLATFSPPAEISTPPLGILGDTALQAKTRTNTLGLQSPPQQRDSGFDEPASASASASASALVAPAREEGKNETPVSLIAAGLRASSSDAKFEDHSSLHPGT